MQMFLQILMVPIAYISALWERIRCYIYDTVIVKMTSHWYREFMVTVPPNSVVLDVGIGTATSLVANRDLLETKNLTFHGVDYDDGYIVAANELVKKAQLEKNILLKCASIFDFRGPRDIHPVVDASSPTTPSSTLPSGAGAAADGYDVIYFSGSFMIIPDKEKALKLVCSMLKKDKEGGHREGIRSSGGRVCFTQTFERPGTFVGWFMTYFKPFLKYTTTIDFGTVTYESDFKNTLAKADVGIEEIKILRGSTYWRNHVLVIAKPLGPLDAGSGSGEKKTE